MNWHSKCGISITQLMPKTEPRNGKSGRTKELRKESQEEGRSQERQKLRQLEQEARVLSKSRLSGPTASPAGCAAENKNAGSMHGDSMRGCSASTNRPTSRIQNRLRAAGRGLTLGRASDVRACHQAHAPAVTRQLRGSVAPWLQRRSLPHSFRRSTAHSGGAGADHRPEHRRTARRGR